MGEGRRIVVGVVAGAHGVRGELKIKSFTQNPRAIASYGPLADRTGTRSFRLKLRGAVRGLLIARIDGVDDRDQAEALKGLELTVAREILPQPKRDEWYLADLVGLAAVTREGRALGKVMAVHNFGAGDVVEIQPEGAPSVMLPFSKRVVPEVDIPAGRIVVDPPAEVEIKPGAEEESTTESRRHREDEVAR
jgi:16S rRNA processing protein RimM